jgi:hypothetical protein
MSPVVHAWSAIRARRIRGALIDLGMMVSADKLVVIVTRAV